MAEITTRKHGEEGLIQYEMFADGKFLGTWFGPDEEDAIACAKRNLPEETTMKKEVHKVDSFAGIVDVHDDGDDVTSFTMRDNEVHVTYRYDGEIIDEQDIEV